MGGIRFSCLVGFIVIVCILSSAALGPGRTLVELQWRRGL